MRTALIAALKRFLFTFKGLWGEVDSDLENGLLAFADIWQSTQTSECRYLRPLGQWDRMFSLADGSRKDSL